MSEREGVNEATVAFARSLADRWPEATLPCPFCAAGVKGSRLAKHLGTAFGKHRGPSGWARGDTRRRWDITIDRAQMVALEYELARRSILAPRGED